MLLRVMARRATPLALLIVLASACTGGDSQPTATPPPTQALNPARPTATATVLQATATLTLPPSAADLARTAAAVPPRDPTEQARIMRGDLAIAAVRAAGAAADTVYTLATLTGVRAGREIDGCGRAQSGMLLASVLHGTTVTEVIIDGEDARVCGSYALYDERPAVYLALDPIAADLTALAIDRAARTTEAEPDEIVVASVRPVAWTAESGACAAETAVSGTSGRAAGYRIVLIVGTQELVYHTDFDRLIPCSSTTE